MTIPMQTLELFPSPVFVTKAKGLDNSSLSESVYSIRDAEQLSVDRDTKLSALSNVGGYHTQDILNDERFSSLSNFIVKVMNENIVGGKWYAESQIDTSYIVSMWSIINQKGHANVAHNHPHAWFSGVYYPKIPQDFKQSGNICFKDPNSVRQFTRSFYRTVQSEQCCISPEEGTLILFPGWLEHSVGPNLTNDDRIAIAFNIKTHPIEY